MIDRQVMSPERQNELEKRLDKSGHDVLQGTVATDSPNSGLLSGEFILPPEAHRSRNGSTMIAVLMDDADYVWNTMDALANYYTDYVLNEVYTNWDSNTLESEIQGSDLVLISFGHWLDNYDISSLEAVLSNYVESGGGLLFAGLTIMILVDFLRMQSGIVHFAVVIVWTQNILMWVILLWKESQMMVL